MVSALLHVTGKREVGSILGWQVEISRLREDAGSSKVRAEPDLGLLSCLDLIPGPPSSPQIPSVLLTIATGIDYSAKRKWELEQKVIFLWPSKTPPRVLTSFQWKTDKNFLKVSFACGPELRVT